MYPSALESQSPAVIKVLQMLGTAYFLGVPAERLHSLYEEGLGDLSPWEDAPGEISRHDWRSYLSEPK